MTAAGLRPLYAGAALAAIGAAILFAMSPLAVICLGAIAWGLTRAIASLDPAERLPVGGALIIGVLARAASVFALFLSTSWTPLQFNVLFGDGQFAIRRSLWILNVLDGVPISPYDRTLVYGRYGDVWYHYGLAVLQWCVGPAPYGIPMVSVAFFTAFAVIFYRLVRSAFGATVALTALVIILFWPTIFVWSISPLKESLQFLLMILAVDATLRGVRATGGRERAAQALVALAACGALSIMRTGGLIIAAGGIAIGLFGRAATLRSAAATAALAAGLVVAVGLATRPSVQARVMSETQLAFVRHLGHVHSGGISYRAADPRLYIEDPEGSRTMTPAEGTRFLLRSAAFFLVAPLPRHVASSSGLLFVPEQLTWLALVGLAVAGIPAALRRDPLVTLVCLGYIVMGLAVIAPNSGNVGTLVRHRDMVVPFVAALASVGAVRVLSYAAA
jgi:hypothetical protein